MPTTVLLVDDEEDLRVLVQAALESHGFQVILAQSGLQAIKSYFDLRPDLVVLDIRMPGIDGWQVLQRLREVGNTPILMLSALSQVDERVKALRDGADDYLTKPFSLEELTARCDALLRRGSSGTKPLVTLHEDTAIRIDPATRTVHLRGERVWLTPTEFSLLNALARNSGSVVEHSQLIEAVWGSGMATREGLRLYIRYLRKKLYDDGHEPLLIRSVRGFGYMYSPPSHPDTTVADIAAFTS